MGRSIITLTTDFGDGSPYVAQMKGAILSLHAEVNIVDITHGIPAQDIRHGALILDEACRHFPENTIHVAVVDPGVGTQRAIVAARLGRHWFVAPDNGLLSLVATRTPRHQLIVLNNPAFWRPDPSATFHGRDIMAPVAAQLSLGIDADRLGDPHPKLVTLDWPPVKTGACRLGGVVLFVDSFGNAVTNITAEMVSEVKSASSLRIRCRSRELNGIIRAYGQRDNGAVVALLGSSNRLEIAVVQGSAARELGIAAGDEVEVTW